MIRQSSRTASHGLSSANFMAEATMYVSSPQEHSLKSGFKKYYGNHLTNVFYVAKHDLLRWQRLIGEC